MPRARKPRQDSDPPEADDKQDRPSQLNQIRDAISAPAKSRPDEDEPAELPAPEEPPELPPPTVVDQAEPEPRAAEAEPEPEPPAATDAVGSPWVPPPTTPPPAARSGAG